MTSKQLQRFAKAGMTVSLGALVYSAASPGPRRKRMVAHTWQGLALIGFSVWHYNLYPPARRANSGEKKT